MNTNSNYLLFLEDCTVIVKKQISVLTTNEDSCDDWPGGGPGNRQGPTTLH